ncbi:MFS family permease [Microbacterium terrae]|uniref:Major Facilitator Superfamily protein n=1 Tax=Microbacterium terrae TaxID=69369 RepID=A0A0M2H837_9MICO|nr:MFS transporter [Microbacterium terrae]KJL40146.1 Major Facilitator Superfamily protein [Microbacterium terrae]MBP1079290.1 MFS family permease [Microbacterium terrae]GLJ98689.1 MFS transporter [Microbacterium terrae]
MSGIDSAEQPGASEPPTRPDSPAAPLTRPDSPAAPLTRPDSPAAPPTASARPPRRGIHPAWFVAGTALIALVGAAGFRAAPGVLMLPLHEEFGWSIGEMSIAVTLNLLLFGLTAPFAAALMQRFGIRAVTTGALLLIATGSALTVFVTAPGQLLFTWGLFIGLGTGSMALVFAATVTDTWFAARRGLVSGVLTAGSATGQLIFLPIIATAAEEYGWRIASIIIASGALIVVPLVLVFLRDRPSDLGVGRYGEETPHAAAGSQVAPAQPIAAEPAPGTAEPQPAAAERESITAEPEPTAAAAPAHAPTSRPLSAGARALGALRDAAKVRSFWALVAGFAICGATTNGLVGIHFIPSAHDHGMPQTTAAGLLALVGIFDIVGTVLSGWLTDRVNPRILLAAYYAFRGVSLLFLPSLLAAEVQPSMLVFIIFYGLDWVATVPPTIALCRELFGDRGPLVFGWVFAAHQVGAGIASAAAGFVRDETGHYTYAWFAAAALCAVAALVSGLIARRTAPAAG